MKTLYAIDRYTNNHIIVLCSFSLAYDLWVTRVGLYMGPYVKVTYKQNMQTTAENYPCYFFCWLQRISFPRLLLIRCIETNSCDTSRSCFVRAWLVQQLSSQAVSNILWHPYSTNIIKLPIETKTRNGKVCHNSIQYIGVILYNHLYNLNLIKSKRQCLVQ